MEEIKVGDWVYCGVLQKALQTLWLTHNKEPVVKTSCGALWACPVATVVKCHFLPSGHLVRPFVLEEALAGARLVSREGGHYSNFQEGGSQRPDCNYTARYSTGGFDYAEMSFGPTGKWANRSEGEDVDDLFLLVATPEELAQLKGGDAVANAQGLDRAAGKLVTTEGRGSGTNAQQNDANKYMALAFAPSKANADMIARDQPHGDWRDGNGIAERMQIRREVLEQAHRPVDFNGVLTTFLDPTTRHGKLDPAAVLVDWEDMGMGE